MQYGIHHPSRGGLTSAGRDPPERATLEVGASGGGGGVHGSPPGRSVDREDPGQEPGVALQANSVQVSLIL